MFDIAPSEFLLVAFVALVVIGPKDLPKAMRVVGYWVGRARAVGRQFRAGFDEMVREAELEEMEKKWKAENERIMREHPLVPPPPADAGSTDAVFSADADTTRAPVMVEKPRVLPAASDEHGGGHDADAPATHDHREPAPMLPPIAPDGAAAPHDPVIQDKAAS